MSCHIFWSGKFVVSMVEAYTGTVDSTGVLEITKEDCACWMEMLKVVYMQIIILNARMPGSPFCVQHNKCATHTRTCTLLLSPGCQGVQLHLLYHLSWCLQSSPTKEETPHIPRASFTRPLWSISSLSASWVCPKMETNALTHCNGGSLELHLVWGLSQPIWLGCVHQGHKAPALSLFVLWNQIKNMRQLIKGKYF